MKRFFAFACLALSLCLPARYAHAVLVNFDSIDASAGAVEGAPVVSYLAGFGITFIGASGLSPTRTSLEPPRLLTLASHQRGGPAVDVTDQLEPLGQSSDGNEFRYDPAAGQWIFNFETKAFSAAGTYTVSVEPGDTSYDISPTCMGQFVRAN